MTDSKAAATVEDALLEIYSNEAADEFSTIKNICISDAAVGNVIFQVNATIMFAKLELNETLSSAYSLSHTNCETKLLLLCIQCMIVRVVTHIYLIYLQRVYKWKDSSAFSNLGSLIQVFYQFAREVDDGGYVTGHHIAFITM